jgi:hypothetical protein
VGRDAKLGMLDYLRVSGFNAKTSKSFAPITGSSGKFSSDVAIVTYEFDVDKQGISDGENAAIKVSLDDKTNKHAGAIIPLELSFTTSGGTESTGTNTKNETDEPKSMSPLVIVLLTLAVVAMVAALAWIAQRIIQKKRRANNPTDDELPPPANNL